MAFPHRVEVDHETRGGWPAVVQERSHALWRLREGVDHSGEA
nr:hypothetical protein [Kibdelosporangium sp. MJ126-NF4]CTQ91726.1 hypothetical protein [Kibdelosporangium sp. MJ126-NF4]